MSRLDLATTLIVGVCLALLAFLIYKAVNLYNDPADPVVIAEPDSYYDNNNYQDAEDIYTDADSLANAGTLDDDLTYDDVTPADTDTYEDNEYDDSEMDNDPSEVTTDNTVPITSTASAGDYLVIAGSYRQKINAENQVSRLRGMGYNAASVALFNRGALAVALVDRFSTYSDARTLHRELSGKGVEAFIKKKR